MVINEQRVKAMYKSERKRQHETPGSTPQFRVARRFKITCREVLAIVKNEEDQK